MLSVTYLLPLETTHVKKQHYTSSNRRLWSAVKILVCFLLDIFVSWWPDKCL